MSGYRVTTEDVRRWYATWPATTCATRVVPEHLAEFDAWLAEVTKEAYLDGLKDGIVTARRIEAYSDVIPDPSEEPTIPLNGARIDSGGLTGSGGTSGRGERHEAATGRFCGFWYMRPDGSIPGSVAGVGQQPTEHLADARAYSEGRPLRVVAVYEVEEGQ